MLASSADPFPLAQYVMLALIPLVAVFGAWLIKQLMAHARLLASITAEMAAHIKVDDAVHTDIRTIADQVDSIRLEQMRVATQLTTSTAALVEIGHAAQTAATAAATAIAIAAQATAKVVAQTAVDTAAVLAAPHGVA